MVTDFLVWDCQDGLLNCRRPSISLRRRRSVSAKWCKPDLGTTQLRLLTNVSHRLPTLFERFRDRRRSPEVMLHIDPVVDCPNTSDQNSPLHQLFIVRQASGRSFARGRRQPRLFVRAQGDVKLFSLRYSPSTLGHRTTAPDAWPPATALKTFPETASTLATD